MKVNELLQMPLETLLVAFFNTSKNKTNNLFEIQSNYRETKFLELNENSYYLTAEALTEKYNIEFRVKNKSIICEIINEENISLDKFLNLLYEKIIVNIKYLENDYLLDIEIATAMFLLRGSADFNRSLYSVDLKNPTPLYLENIFKILLSSDVLLSKLNFNFRELQPQYVNNERRRNSQIRINLKWFYDNVILKYKFLNEYKTNILIANQTKLGENRNFSMFENRLIFYREKIIGRKLNSAEIEFFRQNLDFENKLDNQNNKINIRNQKIVAYARETLKDVCVGCSDIYDIKDRTFVMHKLNKYYLEINHVVPFASGYQQVDVLDNLVKLCPVCHRALTPNRADPKLQKDIIRKMIESRKEVSRFVESIMPKNYKSAVDYVFDNLK